MDAILFNIFYAFIWVISILPLQVLYLLSDLIFVFICYFPGYRKKVVINNLRNAFPDMTEKERKRISRRFYRHLADMFIEIIKILHMSEEENKRRLVIENPELLEELYSEKRDVIAVLGHYSNWEFLTILPKVFSYNCLSIYKPLKNKYFDKLFIKFRSKYGNHTTPMSMVVRDLVRFRSENKHTFTLMLSDQTPAKMDIHYWTTFLNQETAVYLGAEKISAKYGMAVVFLNYRKVKRGFYRLKYELICRNAAELPEFAVTEAHVKRLEEIIREEPQYWIWSHRRWKHKHLIADA